MWFFVLVGLCSNFDLSFPIRAATSSSSVQNIPDMLAFTIAFWLRTDDTENPGTPLSYSNIVDGKLQDNTLVIQDYGAFTLHINNKKLFIGTSANDGKWHHVAITWESNGGKWFFYKDGREAKRLVWLPSTLPCVVQLGPAQTPLHSCSSCAEPNWWIKYGKRAASESIWYGSFKLVRQKCQARQSLSHYSTLERQLIHTALLSSAEPKADIKFIIFSYNPTRF